MKKNTLWFVGCNVMGRECISGKTAAQWRNEKGINGKTPNIKDFVSAEKLVVLINLEDTNADLIRQALRKKDYLVSAD